MRLPFLLLIVFGNEEDEGWGIKQNFDYVKIIRNFSGAYAVFVRLQRQLV
jgi:hypothetical protein